MRTLDDVDLTAFDFLDFGAGDGASLRRCQELFGGRGVGIDIDERKIQAAQAAGLEVVKGDILKLPRDKCVRYVCMDNFLEHLPDLAMVREMLRVAVAVATDFLYIVHPSFEDEAYLASLGLKQFWQDWTGHPSHVLLSDFTALFSELDAGPMHIQYVQPAASSLDSSILPLSAPADQHHYDAAKHGEKPEIEFSKPVHWQLKMTVMLSQAPPLRAKSSRHRFLGLCR
jgi:SAM-dependent methyltransferase